MKPTTTTTTTILSSNNSAILDPILSMNNTNFESYYHNICASLQSKGEVHSVSKVFAQLPTDEERVKFVLEHRLLTGAMTFQWWKDYNFVQKDRTESQRLRNLGMWPMSSLHKCLLQSENKQLTLFQKCQQIAAIFS